MNILDSTFYGNSLQVWATALVVAAAALITLRIGKAVLTRQLVALAGKTRTQLDDVAADLVQRTKFFFLLLIALYAGSIVLTLPDKAVSLATKALVIAVLLQGAVWGDALVSYLITHYAKKKAEEDTSSVATITLLGFVGRVLVWSAVVLLALDNLGFDITALIAGLGIGGIAVALAAQNVMGDLFASISIVLDKPFVVGDFIIIGDHMGTVEYVGIKTTRIRSLSGEQLVFSNNDLLQSRIRNYKRMSERRVVFAIGVIYQIPYEKLTQVSGMLREIVDAQEHARFDRAHFKSYGDFALNFEIVYYVQVPDYNVYMDIQQAINLAIFRRFQEEGIEFAYPTQTLYVEKD